MEDLKLAIQTADDIQHSFTLISGRNIYESIAKKIFNVNFTYTIDFCGNGDTGYIITTIRKLKDNDKFKFSISELQYLKLKGWSIFDSVATKSDWV